MRSLLVVCLVAVLVEGVNASPTSLSDDQSRVLLNKGVNASSTSLSDGPSHVLLGEKLSSGGDRRSASLVFPKEDKFNFTAPKPGCLDKEMRSENSVTLVYGTTKSRCELTMQWNKKRVFVEARGESEDGEHEGNQVKVEVDGGRIIVHNSKGVKIIDRDFGCRAEFKQNDNTVQGDFVLDVSIKDDKAKCEDIALEFGGQVYEPPTTTAPATTPSVIKDSNATAAIGDGSDGRGLPPGAIVGIVLGCIAFLLLVVASVIGGVCWYKKCHQKGGKVQAIPGPTMVTCVPGTGAKPVGTTQAPPTPDVPVNAASVDKRVIGSQPNVNKDASQVPPPLSSNVSKTKVNPKLSDPAQKPSSGKKKKEKRSMWNWNNRQSCRETRSMESILRSHRAQIAFEDPMTMDVSKIERQKKEKLARKEKREEESAERRFKEMHLSEVSSPVKYFRYHPEKIPEAKNDRKQRRMEQGTNKKATRLQEAPKLKKDKGRDRIEGKSVGQSKEKGAGRLGAEPGDTQQPIVKPTKRAPRYLTEPDVVTNSVAEELKKEKQPPIAKPVKRVPRYQKDFKSVTNSIEEEMMKEKQKQQNK